MILRFELLSKGVYWILTIIIFPSGLYFKGNNGILEDGLTVRDDPITKHKSDFAAS